jgi:hypothetical protein
MAINWGQIEERFKNSDRSIDLQRKEYFVLRYKQSYKSRKSKLGVLTRVNQSLTFSSQTLRHTGQ